MEGLQNLELSVFVPLVLEDLLDGYCLPSLSYGCLKYNPKRSISDNLLSIVSQTLLY